MVVQGATPPTKERRTWASTSPMPLGPSAPDHATVTRELSAGANESTHTTPLRTPNATDGPRLQRIVVAVQGTEYDLPTPTSQMFEAAVAMAIRYSTLLTRKPGRTPRPDMLRTMLEKMTIQFLRAEAERVALEDAGGYSITEERLDRDITHLLAVVVSLEVPER